MSEPTKPLRFSVGLFPYDRFGGIDSIVRVARRADDLGFFALQFPEHIVMPVRPDVAPLSVVWYDNFVLATHLASLTKRLRFVFNVMVVPYRHPIVTAKMISTLDVVSGGRLIVGVGAGWLKGEFRILGIPREERGAMTDEYLRAMKILWTEENPEFQGRYVSFSNVAFQPKCLQKPSVPLWIGGTGARPFRRVVELGDGWTPMTGTLEEVSRHILHLKEAVSKAGRDPESLDFTFRILGGAPDEVSDVARSHAAGARPPEQRAAPTKAEILDRIAECRRAGLNHLTVGFAWRTPADYIERLEWFAAEVMSALT